MQCASFSINVGRRRTLPPDGRPTGVHGAASVAAGLMARIVTTDHRYRRPRRKRAKAAAIGATNKRAQVPAGATAELPPATPANDDRKSAIVTARKLRTAVLPVGLLPDTPEEHRRRGDAAIALWREIVREATGKEQT